MSTQSKHENNPEASVEEKITAYLEGGLSEEEIEEIEALFLRHPEWREQMDEQSRVVELVGTLQYKAPSPRILDNYWEEIDVQLTTKRLGLRVMELGLLLLACFVELVLWTLSDNLIYRTGLVLLSVGFLIIVFNVVRGRLLEGNKDRYRRIKK
jgi:hypothetical protein